ncbi:hypothetical protein WJX73_009845 [Symbiochloris irregularis]|uniref:LamG domain-containing protein n=1 Tax=Symbiochloris irregularis TaxID=706552 RepID=A0AAW1PDJ1_9CHLO
MGYCAELPGGIGNTALARTFAGPAVASGLLGQPLALFPLTPLQLGSITLPPYEPQLASGLGSHASLLFDQTISCSEVQIFLPEPGNAAAGVVRAVVKDASDVPLNSNLSFVFLDSDGLVNANYSRPQAGRGVLDEQWHMVTLTTHVDASPGFSMYLDGRLAGDLNSSSTDPWGNAVQVGGGDPMQLSGPTVLCTRSDLDERRHFSGNLAHLIIFDHAMSATQVQGLFADYATTLGGEQPDA